MDRRSKHLSSEERGVISAEHSRGSSQRSIGGLLGRPASTIGRELSRGQQDDGSYCPHAGRLVYEVRRARCRPARKLIEGSATHRFAHDHLVHRRWSPEQIAQRLRLMNPDDPAARVSHETIYAAIYAQPRGGLKTAMIEALRQHKSKRGRSRTTLAGGSIAPESLRIIHRPEEIEARLVPGHWPYGDAGIACRLTGRRSDQGGLQPLGRGHGGRAQDPLSHSQQNARLHR